jgi:hypothetical protein
MRNRFFSLVIEMPMRQTGSQVIGRRATPAERPNN